MEVAIVGMGPWGLCTLERIVSVARRRRVRVTVHAVEPGQPGVGVYDQNQPDYLILNNACGQLCLYAVQDDVSTPPYALGFCDWAIKRGYSWFGHECRISPRGRPISPGDYLPRRLMGEYLAWFYSTLLADAPRNVSVIHHRARAIDIAPRTGRERLTLDDESVLDVDHVVLTTGHTSNDPVEFVGAGVKPAYPIAGLVSSVSAGEPVGVEGMGLVAHDVVAALSIGRGGSFAENGVRKRYQPSGHEPSIQLYSRSGLPYCAKSSSGVDPTGTYQPIICTDAVLAAVRSDAERVGNGGVDLRGTLLPLIFAEMQARFHSHSASIARGTPGETKIRGLLSEGWVAGRFPQVVADLERLHGSFDPAKHVFAWEDKTFLSTKDYGEQVYTMMESDLDQALAGTRSSPMKAAEETLRILRDHLRSVLEYKGLSAASYVDFQDNVRSRVNRLEAGPPASRSQELLALIDAGVVRVGLGPAPRVRGYPDGTLLAESSSLDRPHSERLGLLVRGHLDHPCLTRSASPLLRALVQRQRLQPLRYDDLAVGSVALNRSLHPIDATGAEEGRLWVLGVLSEGVRYFTHYLPSPQSRLRAVLDAQACAESIVS